MQNQVFIWLLQSCVLFLASKFKYVCCVSISLVAIDTKLRMHDVGQVQCEELVLRMAVEQSCVLLVASKF